MKKWHIMNNQPQDKIRDIADAFQESRILLTAYELGVFTVLGKGAKSADEVARELHTKKRSAERLMNALCAMKLLKKKKGKFSNSRLALCFLVKGSLKFMSGLMHVVRMWDTWGTLTQAVRAGKTVIAGPFKKREKEWFKVFIAAMHERACMQVKSVINLLNLSSVSRVLDVGGGSGAYSMAFTRRKRGIKATVFDLPNVIALTRKYLKQEGLLDKVKTVTGDYNTSDLGWGFDLVFLSAIIHSNSFKENQKLLRKCVKALNPGGQLVIQDFIMDEDRTSPAFGAFFSLNMLVATESGDTYTESEVRGWMKKAGLTGIIRKDTNFGTTLIMGRKSPC